MVNLKVSSAGKLVLGLGVSLFSFVFAYGLLTGTVVEGVISGLLFLILAGFLFAEWAIEGKEKLGNLKTYKKTTSLVSLAMVASAVYLGLELLAYRQISPGLQPIAGYIALILAGAALLEMFSD